ncbi:hypothetical protein CCHR01_16653 [Colletotrichum chrysophilum]|uniref:Uncharacterized protein n=1 Tax=Colletotrichum chrysophilum TaxID=1836956 RepID=A0AAD9A409_9PEZI|nr:hypothetical protein K456DRAFT_1722855 [Colletotrichum gloeosporioides 23]KAK1840725.1 hypothetical protein CCHR01_16653 [Colletotrichum chrysophilum]
MRAYGPSSLQLKSGQTEAGLPDQTPANRRVSSTWQSTITTGRFGAWCHLAHASQGIFPSSRDKAVYG